MKFADREAAGRQLATKLAHLKDRQPVVLALPRGGVAVGFEIARALDAPLDIVLVRKIGVPWQPELALGAVTDGAENCTAVRHCGSTENSTTSVDANQVPAHSFKICRRRPFADPDRIAGIDPLGDPHAAQR